VVEQLLDLPRQPVLPHGEARVRHG